MKTLMRVGLVLVLISFVFDLPTTQAQLLFSMRNPLEGKEAPEFSLVNQRGKKTSMTEFRDGKSAIIFFWATWCPHCRTALTKMNRMAKDLDEKQIKVILVDLDEPIEKVRSYLSKNKINFDVLIDQNSLIAQEYSIIGVPTFFLVGKDGIVKQVENGLPDNYEEILLQK